MPDIGSAFRDLKRIRRLPSLLLCVTTLTAQTPAPSVHQTQTVATLARVTAVRDDFIRRIHALSLTCPMVAPKMDVRFVPSFGNYDDASNTVATSDWTMLPPEQKALFSQLAGPGADEAAAHAMFEDTMHRWMLVHELAHWWQTCRDVMTGRPLFDVGVEADRITLAYWRQADPAFPPKMAAVVQGLIEHAPNPVPPGQTYQQYFNQNHETLGPVVPWFAAHMILTAYNEQPAPTFAQTLALSRK